MKRREFTCSLTTILASQAYTRKLAAQTRAAEPMDHIHSSVPSGPTQQVAMVVCLQMTALDLVGPQTFLAALGNVDVHLVRKTGI